VRLVDLGFALVLLPIWLPLLLVGIGAALLLQGWPVFYRAERMGRNGRIFPMLKLRSMVLDADARGPAVAGSRDSRITPIGQLLRRTKIDELPQFFHLLSGEMSLVGPRPEAPAYLPFYTPAGYRTLRAKPGITSYGSLYFFFLEGSRKEEDFEQFYVRDALPAMLLLEERSWMDMQRKPLRTALRLSVWTFISVVYKLAGRASWPRAERQFREWCAANPSAADPPGGSWPGGRRAPADSEARVSDA
jgi:lipopolysaccharide/colanic/teichoic acid biosynthesis glycosyltransferase